MNNKSIGKFRLKDHVGLGLFLSFLLTGAWARAGYWVDSYYPLNGGDTKTFVYSGSKHLTLDTADDGSGAYEIDENLVEDDQSATEYYQKDDTGIYLEQASLSGGWINVYLDPAVLLLNDSILQNGGSVSTSTTVSQTGAPGYPAVYKVSVSKAGKVTVPVGSFANCLNLSVTETATVPGRGTVTAKAVTAVLAPSVGIIKKLVSAGVWAELVSGTVGGTDVGILASGPPVLMIKTPVKGQRVLTNGNNVPVTGSVSGYLPGMQVFYQVNSGSWANAVVAGTNWSGSVVAVAGTNIVNAYALDSVGRSSPTNSVAFQFVVTAVLVVQTNGNGTVTPNYNNKPLEIGKSYSMTATPGRGFRFAGWTGSQVAATPKLTFQMASNLTFTAQFVDTQRPALAILSPKANAKLSTAECTVVGKASDNVGVTAVFCQANGAGWSPATTTSGYTNWTATVTLVPGVNSIAAFAQDAAGNCSLTNTVKCTYAPPPVTGFAPATLTGLVGQMVDASGSVNELGFGEGTYALSSTNTSNTSKVGNYTYTVLSSNTVQLTTTDIAPPTEAGNNRQHILTFTNSTTCLFTNDDGSLGTITFAATPNVVPSPSSILTVNYSQLSDPAAAGTIVLGGGMFTNYSNYGQPGQTVNNWGTYSLEPFSPVAAMMQLNYTDPNDAGTTNYTELTFTTSSNGTWFTELLSSSSTNLDVGDFTVASVASPPAGNAPMSLVGKMVTVKPGSGNKFSVSFGDDSFCQFDASTNDNNCQIADYTYIKTGANTGILVQTTVLPPNQADLSGQNFVYLTFTSSSGGIANPGTPDAASFTLATANTYAPVSLAGRTLTASAGHWLRFNNDGTLTDSSGTKPYTYAQFSPVGGLLIWVSSDDITHYFQLQFTSATGGSVFGTNLNADGTVYSIGTTTFSLK